MSNRSRGRRHPERSSSEAHEHEISTPVRIAVCVEVDGGDLVVVVDDHGRGMSQETLERAFDPFYSTRPEAVGMGMGLFVARAHLRQLGGTIELRNRTGVGASARVRLPLVPKA